MSPRPCPKCGGELCTNERCWTDIALGGVIAKAQEAMKDQEAAEAPESEPCKWCDGRGRTEKCANCSQPAMLIRYGGCDHTCWHCGGTGKRGV